MLTEKTHSKLTAIVEAQAALFAAKSNREADIAAARRNEILASVNPRQRAAMSAVLATTVLVIDRATTKGKRRSV